MPQIPVRAQTQHSMLKVWRSDDVKVEKRKAKSAPQPREVDFFRDEFGLLKTLVFVFTAAAL